MSSPVLFYNPREASAEVLEAMLVGRDEVVSELEEDLRRQSRSATRQHWLIRGPRGIGKTHLMGILYHRVRQNGALSAAYLPVWLSESEVYEVYSVAILLLGIARQLVEELRNGGDSGASAMEDRIRELEHGGDDPALFEELCEVLREEAGRRGKILLVLMENLDALFSGFAKQRSGQEVRRLRSLLTEEKHFLFLSTTPTRYLAQISDPKAPLYGHLKERTLQTLTEDQVGELFRSLGKVTGQRKRGELLAGSSEEGRLRRRVVHRLAGGNPRSVVMAFSVIAGVPGVKAVVEEMSALLDAQTAYFEARLAQLAPRERAIVAAMALAPNNLTLQEISRLTRLPERSLSTQTDRLIEKGHLAPVEGESGKGTIYELTDGLFRVWYQYRKGRRVLWPIVHFLSIWFSEEELERDLSNLLSEGIRELDLLEGSRTAMAVRHLRKALEWARSEEGKLVRAELWKPTLKRLPKPGKLDFENVISNLEKTTRGLAAHSDPRLAGIGMSMEVLTGSMLAATGREEKAEEFISLATARLTAGAPLSEKTLPQMLHMILLSFDRKWIQTWTALLSIHYPDAAETARLYRLVVEVLEAGDGGGAREGRSAARQRRALARVPPELRRSVEELVAQAKESHRRSREPRGRRAPQQR